MLQIDHIYEFLYQTLFKDFHLWYPTRGIIKEGPFDPSNVIVFKPHLNLPKKIFFYDQEPFILQLGKEYVNNFVGSVQGPTRKTLVTSEYSQDIDDYCSENNLNKMYYFFHGFAALDWYRGYYALNYNKLIVKQYNYDFISFNRIISSDRSYRIYYISQLIEQEILKHGLISFGVADDDDTSWQDEVNNSNTKLSTSAIEHIIQHLPKIKNKLVIDQADVHGSASANIPRTPPGYFDGSIVQGPLGSELINADILNVDAFWHVVTETVFYYNKLHLTEKIFKPIVSKQPFMLLASPGNLAYLRSYGFKTFDSIIDESYDNIQDNDTRIEAVVKQLAWYCNLSDKEKQDIICAAEPIIEFNFHHFYGEFQHIITKELISNTQTLFQEIGYDGNHINYHKIQHILTH